MTETRNRFSVTLRASKTGRGRKRNLPSVCKNEEDSAGHRQPARGEGFSSVVRMVRREGRPLRTKGRRCRGLGVLVGLLVFFLLRPSEAAGPNPFEAATALKTNQPSLNPVEKHARLEAEQRAQIEAERIRQEAVRRDQEQKAEAARLEAEKRAQELANQPCRTCSGTGRCPTCEGAGRGWTKCASCSGTRHYDDFTGMLPGRLSPLPRCFVCRGRGRVIIGCKSCDETGQCPACRGKGRGPSVIPK